MTSVFPTPIIVVDFLSQTSADVCSRLVISFTALLYLAMTLAPFLRESDTEPPKHESPDDTFQQGEEK